LTIEPLEPRALLDAAGPVVINEFMAVNASTLTDLDQEYSDWIELHNVSDRTVNLDGWHLTDEADDPTKWDLPSVVLQPGAFHVVFASGKDRRNPAWELHTNFKLSGDGEYLGLILPDGQTVAHEYAPYPRQSTDVSYGMMRGVAAHMMPAGAELAFHVPTAADGELGTEWTTAEFSDPSWTAFAQASPLLITEAGTGDPDYIEIQNLSATSVNTAGWVVAANVGTTGKVSQAHTTLWQLPEVIPAGEVLYRSDDAEDVENYFGGEILWRTIGYGWVMIVDDVGNVADFVAWGYPVEQLAALDLEIAGHRVTLGDAWLGAGVALESVTGKSLQRHGGSDHNNADDWAFLGPMSKGNRNTGLADPFAIAVATGIGFDAADTGLDSAVQIDVEDVLYGVNSSLLVRIPFDLLDLEAVDALRLQMNYNDGFVAYLNGRPVASRNTPAALPWNAAARAPRSVEDSLQTEVFDLTGYLSALRPGVNVLAIHALNVDRDNANFLISPGLMTDSRQYFMNPTPKKTNVAGFVNYVGDTKFSFDRGFYDAPFDVAITSDTPGATIYYTLDGSQPTETHGIPYDGTPLRIETTAVLRAAAYKTGMEPSNVDTQTYIFLNDVIHQDGAGMPAYWGRYVHNNPGQLRPAIYDMDPRVVNDPRYRNTIVDDLLSIPTLSLTLAPDDLWSESRGIYANTTEEGLAWERPVSAELFDADGTEGFQIDAGARIHGGWGRRPYQNSKHSFRLIFRGQYGASKLDYPLFGDQAADEFDTLVLRAGFNDSWRAASASTTYIQDRWAAQTQNEMGGYGPHGTWVHLYLNGLYWGLYNPVERPNAAFAASYFGGDKEDYDAYRTGGLIDGNSNSWNQLRSLVRQSSINYPAVERLLDIPRFIDYVMINHYGANWDWPGNNWYASHRRGLAGKWYFHSWDAEGCLDRGVYENRVNANAGNSSGEIYTNLRRVADFRLAFADRVHRNLFNDGLLTPTANRDRLDSITSIIDRAIVGESARWGDGRFNTGTPCTRDGHWLPQINYLRTTYVGARTAILLQQYRDVGLYPRTNAPVFSQHGGPVDPGFALSMTATKGKIYYTLDGSDPRLPGGSVSPAANLFDGTPVAIDESYRVKSRVLDGATWSALNEARFYVDVPAGADNLAITEIHFNPADPTAAERAALPPRVPDYTAEDFEFIELENISADVSIDLTDVAFTDGIAYEFNAGSVRMLRPGEYIVIASNPAAFEARYGTDVDVAGQYTGKLDNGGEQIILTDYTGQPIFNFRYGDGDRWPGRADGKGASMRLADPDNTAADLYGTSDAWRSSVRYGGTPGNGPDAELGVVVNEVLTHTDYPEVDAVELHNANAGPVDLGGWFLSDRWGWARNELDGDYRKFRIPEGTSIPAGGYVTFYEGHYVDGSDVLQFDPIHEFGGTGVGDFALNGAEGDHVWLMQADAAGNLLRFADHVEFPAAANGETFGRAPNVVGDLYPLQANTLGGHNAPARIGPLVIGEVMYHPGSGGVIDEFVELVNLSGQTVPLFDPLRPLNTWRIGGLGFRFPQNVEVPSGGVVLVVSIDPDDFRTRYNVAADVQIFGPYGGSLDNAGENVRLLRPDAPTLDDPPTVPELLVDRCRYRPDGTWPAGADGLGDSLHRAAADAGGTYAASWQAAAPTPGDAANLFTTRIAGRHVFYNGSSFDGNDAAATAADDAAIAVDKTALLPGQTATGDNYTNYGAGINGLMVDVAMLPPDVVPSASDFRFRMGNVADPAAWGAAPQPIEVTLRRQTGAGRSDRITLVWADNAIRNQWLQVTVVGTNLGLSGDDVFYFGNAVAEAGNSAADAQVTTTDLLLARNNPRSFLNPAAVDFPYDYNRDGRVTTTDVLLARNNQTNFINRLRLLDLALIGLQADLPAEDDPIEQAIDALVAAH